MINIFCRTNESELSKEKTAMLVGQANSRSISMHGVAKLGFGFFANRDFVIRVLGGQDFLFLDLELFGLPLA